MGVLDFVSSLTGALAWPLAVLVAVLVLRRPIVAWLAERPKRLKVGTLELEWDTKVAQIQTDLDQPGVPDPAGIVTRPDSAQKNLYLLAQTSPAAAIVQASLKVEDELRARLSRAGVEVGQEGLGALAALAYSAGLITLATQNSIAGLVALRNLAVHRTDAITSQEALEYIALADASLYAMDASSQVRQSVKPGSTNIRPDDIAQLARDGKVEDLVSWALASGASSVKQRQIAIPLIDLGYLDEAVRIGLNMQNRAELRTVCNAIVTAMHEQPEMQDQGWAALERLRERLRPPQIRDVHEKIRELGIEPRGVWK